MYAFLVKKIAIPGNQKVRTLAWNPEHGWLACGGDDGLLKVLKLDAAAGKEAPTSGGVRGVAAAINLSGNTTLVGHRASVCVSTWNAEHRKLTTADSSGLIIVWVPHKGAWLEDMINNRGKSVVRDMRWRSNGEEICIAYEDGHVILGGVDGTRRWHKELGMPLTHVEWAPDGRWLLFASGDGSVTVYTQQGARIGSLELHALADLAIAPADGSGPAAPPRVPVAALEWYDGAEGYAYPDIPCLAVAFENGRVQLMREADDPKPVLLDTGLRLSQCKWNTSGTVLAVAGTRAVAAGAAAAGGAGGGDRDVAEVQFYTPFGRYVTSMKVLGGSVSSLSWEGGGLRMALGVDSFVFFANIRPAYKWASFGDCVVYSFTRPDKAEQCVVFWNIKTDERHIKYVKRLISVHAAGEHCVLVTGTDPEDTGADPLSTPAAAGPCCTPLCSQYILILCNAIGSPVDSRYIDTRPDHVAMTPHHVAVASADSLYVWHYRTAGNKLTSTLAAPTGSADGGAAGAAVQRRREGRERVFHIDDSGVSAAPSTSGSASGGDAAGAAAGAGSSGGAAKAPTSDAICAITASPKYLLVARESGTVLQFSLPGVTLEHTFTLRCRPASLALNCDSTRFSIIDINYCLSLFDMEARSANAMGVPVQGEHLPWERRDVWEVVWAADYPDLWAAMEKTRMYVFRGTEPEEPAVSSGYLCRFDDLTITSVLMDDVMSQPDRPERAGMVLSHETRSLRDSRMLLARTGLKDSAQFIEDNAHPRLWRLLAETALDKLDLNTAEKAFVACQDYPGIQFVKRLRLLHDRAKQRAEVLLYFRRADEAEAAYVGMDRRDLAVDMRMRLGDWAHVLRLLQRPGASASAASASASSGGGDDALLALARTRMGDYFADRQQWGRAVPFYEAARCYEALVECYYVTESYAALGALVAALPEGSPLLANVAGKLQSVGLTEGAAQALLRAGDIKGAVDACVLLNQWDKALALAERHRLPQIESLLVKYGAHLTDSGRSLTAVDLYKRAGRDAEAAKLLARLAADSARGKVAALRGPLRTKQLYVLAALEVERHRKRTMEAAAAGAGAGGGAAATAAMVTGAGGGAVNAKQAAAMATAAAMSTLLKADADVAAAAASTGSGLTSIGLASGSAAASDAAAARTLDAAWHGAEAFHFLMLAQRQLYEGDPAAAMATACRLPLYEDMLEGRDAFALLALTSFYAGCLGTCSRAFVKLEALDSIPPPERDAFADLALAIFSAARPLDPPADAANSLPCPTPSCRETLRTWSTNCMGCGANFPACVATGRPLFQAASTSAAAAGPGGALGGDLPDLWRCGTCRHRALRAAMHGRVSCPLCHAAVNGEGDAAAAGSASGAAAAGGAGKPRVQPVTAAFRL